MHKPMSFSQQFTASFMAGKCFFLLQWLLFTCNQGSSGLSLRDLWIGQRRNEAAPPDAVSPAACFLSFCCRHPRIELHQLVELRLAQVDVVWILSTLNFKWTPFIPSFRFQVSHVLRKQVLSFRKVWWMTCASCSSVSRLAFSSRQRSLNSSHSTFICT